MLPVAPLPVIPDAKGSQGAATPGDPAAAGREALFAALGIIVALGALKHLAAAIGSLQSYAFALATALQLYGPLLRLGRAGISTASLGLTLARAREDLTLCALLSLGTLLPFAVAYHFWQTAGLGHPFHFRLPSDLLGLVLELAIAAFAEEVFFRGYLQERWALRFPAARRLFGAPFGAALVLTAGVFALAHFVGEYQFERLGPFFPGLLFGLLRARTGTIVGATSYHFACNLLSRILWESYR